MKTELPQTEIIAAAAPLPTWPTGWYVVGRSLDLARGRILDGRIAHRSFVVFRDATGALGALDAHCPHMGAHLRTGRVVGDRVRCALHHWTIGRDGLLQGPERCEAYRSRAWPAFERFGLIFVFAGDASQPVPPFVDLPENYTWLTAKPLLLKADWRAVLVNGFDTLHMRTVHQRELVKPPEVSPTANGGLRMSYQTRVIPGGGLSSWLTHRLSGGVLHISHTCYGPTILVESRLGRFESRAVFGLIAQGENTLAFGAFGAPREGRLRRLRLWLTRTLYIAFLRKDYAVLAGMQLIVDGVSDPGVRGISEYLRSLPELGANGRAG